MNAGTDDALEPVSRESTAAIIAERIRGAIMRGTFPPGTQLGEVDLAARLGVSRGPLREAMQRLVAEGLLRSEWHRGLFVIDLGVEDVRDIYAARLTVEQAAARILLGGGLHQDDPVDHAEAVRELAAAQDAIVAAAADEDPVALVDADAEFHTTLVRLSGSPRLRRMGDALLAETRMCLTALQATRPPPAELVAEHQALLDAVRERDEPRLLVLLADHMAGAVARIERDLGAAGDPDRETVALAR